MTDAAPAPSDDDALSYEETHVHTVYESIASHFSSTRYKPWPVVDAFLRGLRPGSIGLDIGCGNGKYLNVNKEVFIVGSDRSSNLIQLARRNQVNLPDGTFSPHDALVADSLSLPHPLRAFDFAICIAVIHHLSSTERRVAAIRAILDVLRSDTDATVRSRAECDSEAPEIAEVQGGTAENLPVAPSLGRGSGQALIFVWALEQSGSRRGWKEGDEQDVLVPWVLKESGKASRAPAKSKDQTGPPSTSDAGTRDTSGKDGEDGGDKVFNRFYHLYKKGELEVECESADGRVVKAGYDRDNWWVIVEPRAR